MARVTEVPKHIKPSDLVEFMKREVLVPRGEVAVDTETSGLFVDDGARVSTVSLAFFDYLDEWDFLPEEPFQWGGGIYHRRKELIEADNWEWVVSFAWPVDQGVSGTGKKEDTGYATMWADADNLEYGEWLALLDFLSAVPAGLVWHNAKFDLHMMRAGVRRWPGVGRDFEDRTVWCTQVVNTLVFPTEVVMPGPTGPRPTSSLKPVSAWLWGEAESDEQKVIKAYLAKHKLPTGRWDLMPWDVIAKYAEQDARLTIRLLERQKREIKAGKLGYLTGSGGVLSPKEAIQRRLDTMFMLYRVEKRGLPFNHERAQKVSKELNDMRLAFEATLPFKPATLPAAKKFWFGERKDGGLGLTPYSTTEAGAAQVNEMIINKMIKDGVPAADTWRDIQKLKTADERWYAGWSALAGSDGRLRAGIRQSGTVSGRFSVERVQLQAIPHNYRLSEFEVLQGVPTPRQLIVDGVPEGWKLWELDLAQAELRVAALYANCEPMLKLIHEGADLHSVTAQELFHVEPESRQWGFYRNIAKRGNFGLIFGSGAQTFMVDLEKNTGIKLTFAESEKFVKDWNGLYPQFKRAIYGHQSVVESRMRKHGAGWVQLTNGERRWFLPGEETHKSFNQRVQPNLAQFGIDWWLASEQYLISELGDEVIADGQYVGRVGLVMMIHDSQVLLLPDNEEGERMVNQVVKIGTDLWDERFKGVPGGVDAKPFGK